MSPTSFQLLYSAIFPFPLGKLLYISTDQSVCQQVFSEDCGRIPAKGELRCGVRICCFGGWRICAVFDTGDGNFGIMGLSLIEISSLYDIGFF